MSEPEAPQPAEPPVALRVVRGEPTSEELAALVVVLAASAGGGEAPAAPRSVWASSGRARAPLASGPGAWRASSLPG
ncbi:hypothetical protein GCM10027446_05440 [Angustibacter peucedani]